MKVPCGKVYCVGEVTSWGKQFLADLQAKHVIEVSFVSASELLQLPSAMNSAVLVMVENSTESKRTITKLRSATKSFYYLWFGRMFTKEDYQFAVESRAYAVLEHARSEDPKVLQAITKAAENIEAELHFEHVLHSLKAILLEDENNEAVRPVVSEIKTALKKMEKFALKNELSGGVMSASENSTPFYKAQDFADALMTVSELERTGSLGVKDELPGNEGYVEFIQGKIVSAVSGETRGLKAIYRMFLWDQPKFLFSRRDPEDCIIEEQLNLSMKMVCDEGIRLRQRYDRIRREIPPFDLRLELEPSSLHPDTKLTAEEFSTLASVVEFGKVSQVVDNNKLPDVILLEGLIRLKKSNQIRVVATAA